jgi:hypothetical protein
MPPKISVKPKIWGGFAKKIQRQGALNPKSEAYFGVRRHDEGLSATQHMDFLRSRHGYSFSTQA